MDVLLFFVVAAVVAVIWFVRVCVHIHTLCILIKCHANDYSNPFHLFRIRNCIFHMEVFSLSSPFSCVLIYFLNELKKTHRCLCVRSRLLIL